MKWFQSLKNWIRNFPLGRTPWKKLPIGNKISHREGSFHCSPPTGLSSFLIPYWTWRSHPILSVNHILKYILCHLGMIQKLRIWAPAVWCRLVSEDRSINGIIIWGICKPISCQLSDNIQAVRSFGTSVHCSSLEFVFGLLCYSLEFSCSN